MIGIYLDMWKWLTTAITAQHIHKLDIYVRIDVCTYQVAWKSQARAQHTIDKVCWYGVLRGINHRISMHAYTEWKLKPNSKYRCTQPSRTRHTHSHTEVSILLKSCCWTLHDAPIEFNAAELYVVELVRMHAIFLHNEFVYLSNFGPNHLK